MGGRRLEASREGGDGFPVQTVTPKDGSDTPTPSTLVDSIMQISGAIDARALGSRQASIPRYIWPQRDRKPDDREQIQANLASPWPEMR
jgi:hypothetical protein